MVDTCERRAVAQGLGLGEMPKKCKEAEGDSFFEREERQYGRAGNLASLSEANCSASSKLRQAEWTGQLAWTDKNHPSAKAACDWSVEAQLKYMNLDKLEPWMEVKRSADGDEIRCTLCNARCTPEHLTGARHMKKLAWLTPDAQGTAERES